MQDHYDVVIIGAGAAGLAAAARLGGHPLSIVVLEARDRRGGRAHTIESPVGPLDLGCEWLHSADRNPLAKLIEEDGWTVDRSRPPWERPAFNRDFSAEDQRAFSKAYSAFEHRMAAAARSGLDRPGADFFEPGGRWNPLIDAISSFYNGAEYSSVSILDYDAYEDDGINWRVSGGYGAAIVGLTAAAPVITGCEVRRIDRQGRDLRLETSLGGVTARIVIVAVPTPHLAEQRLAGLPEKAQAAAGLPLGLADKVFLQLADPDSVPANEHLFGATDRTAVGSYSLRPLGRAYVEVFLGGAHARALEGEGPGAATEFALGELASLLGSDFPKRLTPLAETRWANDPFALGSYSHALPGSAGARAILAQPLENRIFFAGEATSPHFYSTAHGAWESGVRAAEEALAALD